VTEIL